jgi:hypothetical protein
MWKIKRLGHESQRNFDREANSLIYGPLHYLIRRQRRQVFLGVIFSRCSKYVPKGPSQSAAPLRQTLCIIWPGAPRCSGC